MTRISVPFWKYYLWRWDWRFNHLHLRHVHDTQKKGLCGAVLTEFDQEALTHKRVLTNESLNTSICKQCRERYELTVMFLVDSVISGSIP